MYKFIGISHIVFTVNNFNRNIPEYLNTNFLKPETYIFDHSKIRKPLLRNFSNKISKIDLFKPKYRHLPSIELIQSENSIKRSKNSFGIIDKNLTKPFKTNKIIKLGNQETIKSYFCPVMNVNISNETKIIDSKFGLWLKVFDFESHYKLFSEIFNLKCGFKDDFIAKFKTRAINLSLSPFEIVLFRSSEKNQFYNDDLGFSTIGWLSRNLLDLKKINSFLVTDNFNISFNKKKFIAQFVYNNCLFSNEVLKLTTNGKN